MMTEDDLVLFRSGKKYYKAIIIDYFTIKERKNLLNRLSSQAYSSPTSKYNRSPKKEDRIKNTPIIILIPPNSNINDQQIKNQENIFSLRLPLESNFLQKIKIIVKKYYLAQQDSNNSL